MITADASEQEAVLPVGLQLLRLAAPVLPAGLVV
jgi:hypothetical protein